MDKNKLKETLKKIPLVYPLGKFVKNTPKDMLALTSFMAERKVKRPGDTIRVGFLCQYIPVWHKLEPIYTLMCQDPRFTPVLICVPSRVENGKLADEDYVSNETLDYFHSHGYGDALNALQPDGSWLDLEKLGLSYIFYPRPYNYHMPRSYWADRVSRHTKICLILYGMNVIEEITRVSLNREFFRYVYCYFAELPYSRDVNAKNGWLGHGLGVQQSVYYGMPGIEAMLEGKKAVSPSWDFSKNDFRVMWTPRWTSDPALGGTNFFTYYQFLPEFARQHPDIDFLFRPHPLALQHFQQTGELSAEDAQQFLAACEALENVSLDNQKEYTSTLWGTSALIGDISGLLPEYFVTGKPLIFCASNMVLTPERTTRRMLEASYVVHNAEELEKCLLDLKKGIDPQAEKRAALVAELFADEWCHPARRVVEHLAK